MRSAQGVRSLSLRLPALAGLTFLLDESQVSELHVGWILVSLRVQLHLHSLVDRLNLVMLPSRSLLGNPASSMQTQPGTTKQFDKPSSIP